MAIQRKYRLNLRNYGNLPAIMLSQYDEGYDLVFEIYDGPDAAENLSAYTVKLCGTRRDTLKYELTGTIANNVLSFPVDTTMSACDGKGVAEIEIIKTADDTKFATFNLPVFVEKAAVPNDAVDADVERAQEIAEQVEELIDGATYGAEAWATGQKNGVDVETTDPTYHNNAKYYAEQAQDIADSIGIDATLSITGKAADAKKTGDEIDSLKEDLNDLNDAVGIYTPPTASGTTPQNNSANVVLSPITLVRGHRYKYEITLANASDAAAYLAMWLDGASTYFNIKTIAAGETTASKEFDNTTNTDSAYMTITPNGRALSYTVKITDLSIDGNYITVLQGQVSELQSDTGESKLDLQTVNRLTVRDEAETTTEDITDQLVYTVGSMNTDGTTTTSTSYYYTEKIPVNEGDIVFTTSQYTRYRVVTAFYNGTVVSASGVENVFSYTVPSGVDSIVVTIYANQSRTYGTINITGFGRKQNILKNRVSNAEQNHSHTFSKRHPMVTFIDDDGNVEFYTYLLPIMRTYGIPMVSAYMGDSNPDMQSNASMMTKAQCDEVVKAGGELIVHYNPDATTLTLDEAEAVMVKSKEVLDKYGFGKASRLIAYSHGTSNTDIRAMVSKHFDCAFSGAYPRVSATDRSNHDCIVQYAIHREPCGGLYYDRGADCTTLPYFKDMIDECISSNGWLVFTMHSWLMPEGQRQSPWENVDQLGLLEDIIEYIQSLQQNDSNIEIVTASKGFETFGNAFQAGDYLGHWNEQTLVDIPTLGNHSQAGCAINKLGQYDFPTANNLNS